MITLSLSGALSLITAAYSVLLALKLFTQPSGDTAANSLLATVCFSMAAWSWGLLARDSGLYLQFPHLLFVFTPAFFLLGPALYAYTRRITIGTSPFRRPLAWLHFAPIALFILAALPFYFSNSNEKLYVYQNGPTYIWLAIALKFIVPHMLVYTLLCLRPIRRYEKLARDNFSDLERGNLRWLKRLCIGMLVLLMLDAVLSPLATALQWNAGKFDSMALMRVCLLLYIGFLALSALGQTPFIYKETREFEALTPSAIDPHVPVTLEAALEEKDQSEKYARSGLRDDSARYYVKKLHTLMTDQQAYLDCDLTLRKLASMLKLRPHHLSQVLNEQLGKSFYDYVNEHRIAYSKELMRDSTKADLSILDIAFASGYNNKVSFYNAFKRFVEMTPTRYREAQNQ